MRVDVRAMAPGESATVTLDEPIALQVDEQAVDAATSGTLQIHRTNRGVLVRGHVQATVPLACSRCLLPFPARLRAVVEEEFSLDPPAAAGDGELAAEDFVSWLGPGHEVDLSEIVRQHLHLSLPMAPLHAEDCRGLCPVCGANWNERVCEHYESVGSGIRDKG